MSERGRFERAPRLPKKIFLPELIARSQVAAARLLA
jgi:hypothetical protein